MKTKLKNHRLSKIIITLIIVFIVSAALVPFYLSRSYYDNGLSGTPAWSEEVSDGAEHDKLHTGTSSNTADASGVAESDTKQETTEGDTNKDSADNQTNVVDQKNSSADNSEATKIANDSNDGTVTPTAFYTSFNTTIFWNDNAAKDKRQAFFDTNASLQFSFDASSPEPKWTTITKDNASEVGLSDVPAPNYDKGSTDYSWKVTYANNVLPSIVEVDDGTTKTTKTVSWKYAETSSTVYLAEMNPTATVDNSITQDGLNSILSDFSATIIWEDNSNFYQTRNTNLTDCADISKYTVHRSIQGGTEEEISNNIVSTISSDQVTVTLPKDVKYKWTYNGSEYKSEVYTYSIIPPSGSISGSSDSYVFSFENTTTEIKEALTDGGKEFNRLTGTTNFEFYKTWDDGKDTSTEDDQRSARIYNYKVAEDSSGKITEDGIKNPLYVEGHDSQEMPKQNSVVKTTEDDSLPKYNSSGQKYVYFGIEKDLNSKYNFSVDNSKTTDDEQAQTTFASATKNHVVKYIMNSYGVEKPEDGVVVNNYLYEEEYIPVTKDLNAPSLASRYSDLSFKVRLQELTDGATEWKNVDWSEIVNNTEGKTGSEVDYVIDGFRIEKPSITSQPYKVSKYKNAKPVKYRWVEIGIKYLSDGNFVEVTPGSTEESKLDPSYDYVKTTGISKGTTSVYSDGYFKPSSETTFREETYTSETVITNTLFEDCQVKAKKHWSYNGKNTKQLKDDCLLDDASVDVVLYQNGTEYATKTLNSSYYIEEGTDGYWEFTWGDGTEAGGYLPRFDSDGLEYKYEVKERNASTPKIEGVSWSWDYSTKTTVEANQKSEITGQANDSLLRLTYNLSNFVGDSSAVTIDINKVWIDGDDLSTRRTVKAGIYKKSDKTLLKTVEISEDNNWLLEDINLSILSITDVNQVEVREIEAGGVATTDYKEPTEEEPTISTAKLREEDTSHSLKYNYDVQVEDKTTYKTEDPTTYGKFEITNKKVGYSTIQVNKEWKTANYLPNAGFQVVIYNAIAKTTTPIVVQTSDPAKENYFSSDNSTFYYDESEGLFKTDTNKISTGNKATMSISNISKYTDDDKSQLLVPKSFEQALYIKDETGVETKFEFGNDSHIEAYGEGYYKSSTDSSNISGPEKHNTGDVYKYNYANTKSDTYELTAYKYWRDSNAMSGIRPDITLDIYRISEKNFDEQTAQGLSVEQIETQIKSHFADATKIETQKIWHTESNNWMYSCDLGTLKKYDEDGYHWIYFLQEKTSESTTSEASLRHYKNLYFNATENAHPDKGLRPSTAAASSAKDTYEVTTDDMKKYRGYTGSDEYTNGYLILSDGYAHKNTEGTSIDENQYYSKTIMNYAQTNRVVKAQKIWIFPEEWSVPQESLMNAKVKVYRSSTPLTGYGIETYTQKQIQDAVSAGTLTPVPDWEDEYDITASEGFEKVIGYDESGHPSLARYDSWGEPYYYYFMESTAASEMYPLDKIDYSSADYIQINNTYDFVGPKVEVTVNKTWKSTVTHEEAVVNAITPVKFELVAKQTDKDGNVFGDEYNMGSKVLDPMESGTYQSYMSWTFSTYGESAQLPYYAPNGNPFKYYVREVAMEDGSLPNGYKITKPENGQPNTNYEVTLTSEETGTKYTGTFDFENTYYADTKGVTFYKNWDDSTTATDSTQVDNSGYRPADVNYVIKRKYADNTVCGKTLAGDDVVYDSAFKIPVPATQANQWSKTASDLNKYAPNGSEYTYYIEKEEPVPDQYTSSIAKTTIDKDTVKNTLDTTSLQVSKTWQKNVDGYISDMTWPEFVLCRNKGALPTTITFAVKRSLDGGEYKYLTHASDDVDTFSTADCVYKSVDVSSITQAQFTNFKSNLYKFTYLPSHSKDDLSKNYTYRAEERLTWTDGTTTLFSSSSDGSGSIEDSNHLMKSSVTDGKSFSNIREMIETKEQKTWVDANNRDNLRPSQLTLSLSYTYGTSTSTVGSNSLAKDETTNTQTSTSFYLPKPKVTDSQTIESVINAEYTLNESPDLTGASYGYTKSAQSVSKDGNAYVFGITNTRSIDLFSATASKTWEDGDNAYNQRPSSVTLQLQYKDENEVWQPVTKVESVPKPGDDAGANVFTTSDVNQTISDWSSGINVNWENLPKCSTKSGTTHLITYRVAEIDPTTGYATTASPETFTYDKSGKSITVNNNANGQLIVNQKYTNEDLIKKFDMLPTKVMIKAQVKKSGESEYSDLTYNDGTIVEYGLTSSEKWTHTFSNLRSDYEYQAVLVSITDGKTTVNPSTDTRVGTFDYTQSTTKDSSTSTWTTTLTDKMAPGNLKIEKTWIDGSNRDGLRTSVKVNVYRADTSAKVAEANLTEAGSWQSTLTSLPVYHFNGTTKWTYTSKEVAIDGYTTTHTADPDPLVLNESSTATFSYTNTHSIKTFSATATKSWDDADNKYLQRPSSVKFKLQYSKDNKATWNDVVKMDVPEPKDDDGKKVFTTSDISQTIDSSNWTKKAQWDNLPEKALNDAGEPVTVEYRVVEEPAADGYSTTYTPATFNANSTTKEVTVKNSATGVLNVEQTWTDTDIINAFGLYPDSVKVKIQYSEDSGKTYKDIENPAGTAITQKITKDSSTGKWKTSFTNLSTQYQYRAVLVSQTQDSATVTADETNKVIGCYTYTASTSQESGKFVWNTTINDTLIKGKASAEKKWVDANNRDDKRPTEVNLTFKTTDDIDVEKNIKLNASNSWKNNTKNWPVFKFDGTTKWIYKFVEDAVTSYSTTYSPESIGLVQDITTGPTTITNTHQTSYFSATAKKNWEDKQPELRPDSVQVKLQYSLDGETNWTDITKDPAWPPSPESDPGNTVYTTSDPTQTITPTTKTEEWTQLAQWDNLPENVLVNGASTKVFYKVVELTTGDMYATSYSLEKFTKNNVGTGTNIVPIVVINDSNGVLNVTQNWSNETLISKFGLYPDVITVKLQERVKGTTVYKDVTDSTGKLVTSDIKKPTKTTESWTTKFEDLSGEADYRAVLVSMQQNGGLVIYPTTESTVTEGNISAYSYSANTVTEKPNIQWATTITDTPITGSIQVEKVWADSANRDNYRPASANFDLYNATDIKANDSEIVVNEAGSWVNTVSGIPVYCFDRSKQQYHFAEDAIDKYRVSFDPAKSEISEDSTSVAKIIATNKHTVDSFTATAKKSWVDSYASQRPTELKFKIEYSLNGTDWNAVTHKDAVPDPASDAGTLVYTTSEVEQTLTDWTSSVSWANLPAYALVSGTSTKVRYRIIETTTDGYSVSYSQESFDVSSASKEVTVINTAQGQLNVEQLFNNIDLINKLELLPDNVVVEVQQSADGTNYSPLKDGTDPVNLTLTKGTWTNSISRLRSDRSYRAVLKSMQQTGSDPVNATTDNTIGTFSYKTETTKHDTAPIWTTKITDTSRCGSTSITKNWVDAQNRDGKQASSVKLKLQTTNLATTTQVVMYDNIELNAGNGWKATHDTLPVYKFNGTDKITYGYVEEQVEDYETPFYSPDSASLTENDKVDFTVKNTYTPKVFDFTVDKKWDDNNNEHALRDTSVTLKLQATTDTTATQADPVDDPRWDQLSISEGISTNDTRRSPQNDNGTVVFTSSNISQTITGQPHVDKWTGAEWKDLSACVLVDGVSKPVYYRVVETSLKVDYSSVASAVVSYDSAQPSKTGEVTNVYTGTIQASAQVKWSPTDLIEKYELLPDSVALHLQYRANNSIDPNDWKNVAEHSHIVVTKEGNWATPVCTKLSQVYTYRWVLEFATFGTGEGAKTLSAKDIEELGQESNNGQKLTIGNFNSTSATITQESDIILYHTTIENVVIPTKLDIEKLWNDEDNRLNKCTPVDVKVYKDLPENVTPSEKGNYLIDTVTLNAENGWKSTLDQLPLYANGEDTNKAVYSIEEVGYDTDYYNYQVANNNFNLSSTESVKSSLLNIEYSDKMPRLEINAKKVWDDYDNQYGFRPADGKVNVKLQYALEDEPTESDWKEVSTEELNSENLYPDGSIYTTSDVSQQMTTDEEAVWEELPAYANIESPAGSGTSEVVKVKYRVVEDAYENYATSYEHEYIEFDDTLETDIHQTFDTSITNTLENIPEFPSEDVDALGKNASTGDNSIVIGGVSALIAAFAGVALVIARRRQKRFLA